MLFFLGLVGMALVAFDTVHGGDMLSTGAPPAHTGAPGEQTCARSGCHTGAAVNSGAGMLTLDFNQSADEYVPGEAYEIKVSLDEINVMRFGFELTAISDITGDEAGSLVITDSARMQVIQGPAPNDGRTYITYRFAGTEPVALGKGEWIFNWIAPQTDIGPVSFYLAAVSANDDATDDGDLTYTTSTTILPSTVLGVESERFVNAISLYPNPTIDVINIDTYANPGQRVSVSIHTLSGKKVGDFDFDGCCSNLNVDGYESGVYFVKMAIDDRMFSQRLLILKE